MNKNRRSWMTKCSDSVTPIRTIQTKTVAQKLAPFTFTYEHSDK